MKKQKSSAAQKRLEKKNQKWQEKYGVAFTDCLSKRETTNKGKKKKVNYSKKFNFLLKESKKSFVAFFILGLFVAVVGLAPAIGWQNMIDDLTLSKFESILFWAGIICLFTILTRVLSHISNDLINGAYHNMSHKLRVLMANKVSGVQVGKFDSTSTGEILNRIDDSGQDYSSAIVTVISYIPLLLGNIMYIGYAVYINLWLGLILVGIGFLDFIVTKIYNDKFHKRNMKRGYLIGDKLTSRYTELIRGIRDVKALKATDYLLGEVNKTSEHYRNSSINKTATFQKSRTIKTIISSTLILAFCALGIVFMEEGAVSVGAFIVLIMYRRQIFEFFENLGELSSAKVGLELSSERMYEILNDKDYPKETFGKRKLKNPQGKVEFKKVGFCYKEENPLFKNLSFKIEPNECVAFVGESGQGKSTIMNLITKFYTAQSGSILIDDINLNQISEQSLRDNISVVPQSPYIFNISLKENILLAKPTATQEEIEDACKKAYIHDFIQTLPNKYNTIVGEGGVMLSGGQKQRLAIARAFLKPSRILLFDEATSAIDNKSQAKILKIIQNLRKDHTVIIVAHRLSTIKDCDKIFVVNDHKIEAVGTHKELMETSEIYNKLYQQED